MFIVSIRHYNIEVHKVKCNYGQLDMNVSNLFTHLAMKLYLSTTYFIHLFYQNYTTLLHLLLLQRDSANRWTITHFIQFK